MSDADPTVMRRVMALRQIPAFAGATLDELATLADNARDMSFPAGAAIALPGSRLPTLQLVIDGRIEMANGGTTLAWGPHEMFGSLEVLAGRKCARRAVAVQPTRTLQFSGIEFIELLDDNLGLLLSMMREVARNMILRGSKPLRSAVATFPKEPLGLVEQMILLRRQAPFSKAHLQALAMLAQLSEEVTWPAGAEIVRSGEVATNVLALIEGEVRADDVVYTAGDAVGLVETVAAFPHVEGVRAVTAVRALVSSNIALFDTLEDHTELGLAMLGSFAAAVLDAPCDEPAPAHVN